MNITKNAGNDMSAKTAPKSTRRMDDHGGCPTKACCLSEVEAKAKRLERARQWKADNKERHRACKRKWARENREKVRQQDLRYAAKHPGAVSERNRNYYKKNAAKIKDAAKKWATENKSRMNARTKKWRLKNPEKVKAYQQSIPKEKLRARGNERTARAADGYVKRLLVHGTNLETSDIPQELVELKRKHLKIHRQLKTTKP